MALGNHLEKIAVVGAGGRSGRPMAEELLKAGKQVTAITRQDSKTELPAGVAIARVDYDDQSSLVAALQGHDALVITLSAAALHSDIEERLVQAAATVKIPWILPNVWSPDFSDKKVGEEALVGAKHHDTLAKIKELGVSSWVAVCTGFWYEWSLAIQMAYGFDLVNKHVTMFDDGETRINHSSWPQVGRAVAALLSLKVAPDGPGDKSVTLEKYKNSYVYISSFTASQKEMFESVLRVTGTSANEWKVDYEPVKERYQTGQEQIKKGEREGFGKVLYGRVFFPDGVGNVENTKGLSNAALGLKEENMDDYTKIAIERAHGNPWE